MDAKLVKLAKAPEGTIVTNDFNLNKVAELQGVPVLNVNELANALKPVVLPGEEMNVTIIKEGKEANQGIAYLDDGTMVVVEGARRHIGEKVGRDRHQRAPDGGRQDDLRQPQGRAGRGGGAAGPQRPLLHRPNQQRRPPRH